MSTQEMQTESPKAKEKEIRRKKKLIGQCVEIVQFDWCIDNFREQFGSQNNCIGRKVYSPYFPLEGTQDDTEWQAKVRAGRKSSTYNISVLEDTHLVIHIWNKNPEYSMSGAFPDYCEVRLLNRERKSVFVIAVPKTMSWPDYSFNTACNLSDLERLNPELYQQNGALTIAISIKVDPNPWLQTPRFEDIEEAAKAKPVSLLTQSLQDMLEQDILTDIVIRTTEKDYKCHKVILAARSQVFKAMFQNNMTERESNIVDLSEAFEPDTFKDIIRYIYTEQLPEDMDGAGCASLFVAADYFQLLGLKAWCAEELGYGLESDNAAAILQLADKYGEMGLKDKVVKFISENLGQVVDTEAWGQIPGDVIKDLLPAFLQHKV